MQTANEPFKSKTVLITGGARGQGAEEARLWVEGGGRVVIGDVADEAGHEMVRELGSSARFVHLDVAEEGHWTKAMSLVREFGGLYGLVNNAAIFNPAPLHDTTLESYERHIKVNQIGCFLGMRYAAPLMTERGGGAIVNIGSSAGLRGTPGAFAYSATKWALRGMTKAAAMSLAASNIRVNAVLPGPVDTDMVRFWTPEQKQRRIAKVPLRRFGTSRDIAATVIFVLSEQSAYMTGAEITVDGGITL
jgi:3alpha(or 20beta)-hydroxysteroid dehydrogenase